MSVIPIEARSEARSTRRRGAPRFLERNARWVAEARDTLPLWKQWAAELPEPEQTNTTTAGEPAEVWEEEWSSASLVT
jgi:hypothetical protein